ncbi:hypothetical protein ACOSQ2_005853 [Xanthoceras sorbifolium]
MTYMDGVACISQKLSVSLCCLSGPSLQRSRQKRAQIFYSCQCRRPCCADIFGEALYW